MVFCCTGRKVRRIASYIILLVFLIGGTALADCRGCCTGHGGVVCVDGETICADGTPLSDRCRTKACSACEPEVSGKGHTSPNKISQTIAIANFNIQVFGVSKAGKPEVISALGQIISRFDIVAVQEIRDKSGQAIRTLEETVDALGQDYACVIGPRLGRTASKEQYAYLYRVDTLSCDASYTYDDTARDIFHREPLIARFKATGQNFSFVLITLHTDPDDATAEINALPDVITDARSHFPDETRFLILGDLNADCTYYDEKETSSVLRGNAYRWLITNAMDTNLAASECTYDRIIMTAETAPHFTGEAGVFRFDEALGLSAGQAKAVSDHYPVYGVFTTTPSGPGKTGTGCYIRSAN